VDQVRIEAVTPDGKTHAWVATKLEGGVKLEIWRWQDATYTVHNGTEHLVRVSAQRRKGDPWEKVGDVAPGMDLNCM